MKKILLILLTLSVFVAKAQEVDSAYSKTVSTVTAVHDGDSYKVQTIFANYDSTSESIVLDTLSEWVRIMGVDCPEVISNHITANQPKGVEIGDSLRLLLKGKKVVVTTFGKDIYRRTLATIQLDSIDISALILSKGWGWYISSSLPNDTRKHYQKLRDTAKKKKLGVWSDKSPTEPKKWRRSYWRE